MHLSVTTILAIYFITWWLVLFMVLPFGVHSQHENSPGELAPGTDPGAPVAARLGTKLLITTGISAVLLGLCYAMLASGLVDLDKLASVLPGH